MLAFIKFNFFSFFSKALRNIKKSFETGRMYAERNKYEKEGT